MSSPLPAGRVLLAWALATPLAAQLTYESGALPPQAEWTDGVDLADVDGDGDLDIAFANGQGYGAGGALPQHLFLNDGSGHFTAAHGQLQVAPFNAKMVVAEDFDSDGDPDLLYAPEGPWPAPTERARLLINDGSGTFSDESATRLPDVPMASFGVAAGDVDDDGDLDAVFTDGGTFAGAAAQPLLFLNDGTAHFSDGTAARLPADLVNAQDVTIFDWDGDFDLDIAISGKGLAGKRSRLWLNDGSGHFSTSSLLDGVGSSGTYEIEWGDLDGDASLAGMVLSLSGFDDGFGLQNGGAFSTAPFPPPNGDDDNEVAGFDYDDDGDLDVLIGSLGFGGEKLYRNDGGGLFADARAAIQSFADSTLDLALGDLDGDGDYDLVTAQGESGGWSNRVFLNEGPRDTHAPRILGLETPALDPLLTVFHARTQDAVADDGKAGFVRANLRAWQGTQTALDVREEEAFHQGGGSWRAAVATLAASPGIVLCWEFTDSAGNATTARVEAGDVPPVVDLGRGLAGAGGTPSLTASAQVTPGSTVSISLSGAAPDRPGVLVLGTRPLEVPYAGGTLVPFPRFTLGYTTDAAGTTSVSLTWPAGLPPCTVGYVQALTFDPSAPAALSFSNALALVQHG